MDEKDIPREESFCTYTILPDTNDNLLIVLDASEDERFSKNITVNGPLQIRFYAGAPIILHGTKIGTVCVMDHQVHAEFTIEQQKILLEFSSIVSNMLIQDEQQYIVEDHLILPILISMYKDLLTRINDIFTLKKASSSSSSSATPNSPAIASSSIKANNQPVYLLPFSNRSSTKNHRRSSGSSMRPEIQILWNTFKQNILNYHCLIEDRFLTHTSDYSASNTTIIYSKNTIPDAQQNLYSFHLPQQDNSYMIMSKYVKLLQNSLIGLEKNILNKIKWDYAFEENIELGIHTDKYQEYLSLILSFFLLIQLQKWKTIKINVSISDEEKLFLPPPSSFGGASRGVSSNGLSTGHPSPIHTQRHGPLSAAPSSSAVSTNGESNNNNNNIGVIKMHLDITCTNRFNASSWMTEDHQFYHELETLYIKSWQLIQGKFMKDPKNNKINEIIHISYPIVCKGNHHLNQFGTKKSSLNRQRTNTKIPHLRLFDSVRSFNRSSGWFRSDSGFSFLGSGSPAHKNGGSNDERSQSVSRSGGGIALNTLDESKGVDHSASTSDKNKNHLIGTDLSEANQSTTTASTGVIHRVWNALSYISGSRSHQAKIKP